MNIRLVGISDRVDLRETPPKMCVMMELEDQDTGAVAEIPLGPVAHERLFETFPDLLANAQNITPAAVTERPAPKPSKAPAAPARPTEAPEVHDGIPEVLSAGNFAKSAEAPHHLPVAPPAALANNTVDVGGVSEDFVSDFLGDEIGDDAWDDFDVSAEGDTAIVVNPEDGEG